MTPGSHWPLVSHPLPVCVRVYARVAATSLCCCLCIHVCVFLKALFVSNMLSIYPKQYMNAHRQQLSTKGEGGGLFRQAGAGRGVGSS